MENKNIIYLVKLLIKQTNNFKKVDDIKRDIINLYEDDFRKIDSTGRLALLFEAIPSQLNKNTKGFQTKKILNSYKTEDTTILSLISKLKDSKTISVAYHANNPGVGMSLTKDSGRYKLFLSDVGLFVTLAFKDKNYTDNVIYNKLLSDKLDANLGYIYENVVAQMLTAKGNNLFYYTMDSDTSNHLYEIDFLISVRDKICPIEVKSGNYRSHKSLDVFCDKFSNRISDKYVVHTKDYKWENAINYIPVYMVPFL